MRVIEDWDEDCPARGAGLGHAHWIECRPPANHPGTDQQHAIRQCCHCEAYLGDEPVEPLSRHVREFEMREYGIPPEADKVDEDAPLVLPQPYACMNGGLHRTNLTTPKIGEAGAEWERCNECGMQIEPKMVVSVAGTMTWINPRVRNKWAEIAYRFRARFG